MSEIVKWRFGMVPIKSATDAANRSALSNAVSFIFGVGTTDFSTLLNDLSVVKGLFNRIVKHNDVAGQTSLQRLASSNMALYRIRADREFFALEYKMACSMMEEYLKTSRQGYYDSAALASSV